MTGERLRGAIDREPVWRKIEDRLDERASRIRNAPGSRLRERVPPMENRNIGGGIVVGSVEAIIGIVLEDVIGFPFGSDVEITNVEPTRGGMIYTVNADAPSENVARARSFLESQTGFASLMTDKVDVRNVELLKTRVGRDTYQVEIMVRD